MTTAEWAVVLGGILAIAAVNWWFFAERRTVVAAERAGTREVVILVQGGYEPSRVRVRAGESLRLIFDRREASGCSEEVVFPSFGVRRFLPPFQKTTIEIRPEKKGRYEFTCGMGMLHGEVEAE